MHIDALQRGLFEAGSADQAASAIRWCGPTFSEFIARVELEFGLSAADHELRLSGFRRDERPHPRDLRLLCAQLGEPAEDFGLES